MYKIEVKGTKTMEDTDCVRNEAKIDITDSDGVHTNLNFYSGKDKDKPYYALFCCPNDDGTDTDLITLKDNYVVPYEKDDSEPKREMILHHEEFKNNGELHILSDFFNRTVAYIEDHFYEVIKTDNVGWVWDKSDYKVDPIGDLLGGSSLHYYKPPSTVDGNVSKSLLPTVRVMVSDGIGVNVFGHGSKSVTYTYEKNKDRVRVKCGMESMYITKTRLPFNGTLVNVEHVVNCHVSRTHNFYKVFIGYHRKDGFAKCSYEAYDESYDVWNRIGNKVIDSIDPLIKKTVFDSGNSFSIRRIRYDNTFYFVVSYDGEATDYNGIYSNEGKPLHVKWMHKDEKRVSSYEVVYGIGSDSFFPMSMICNKIIEVRETREGDKTEREESMCDGIILLHKCCNKVGHSIEYTSSYECDDTNSAYVISMERRTMNLISNLAKDSHMIPLTIKPLSIGCNNTEGTLSKIVDMYDMVSEMASLCDDDTVTLFNLKHKELLATELDTVEIINHPEDVSLWVNRCINAHNNHNLSLYNSIDFESFLSLTADEINKLMHPIMNPMDIDVARLVEEASIEHGELDSEGN